MADKEKMDIKRKKAWTPRFRVSFPHVFEPHSGFEGQAAKYSITALIPKNADLSKNYCPIDKETKKPKGVSLREAAYNALVEKWPKLKKAEGSKAKWPDGFRSPFRDGDDDEDGTKEILEGYSGNWFIRATSKKKPQVVGPTRDESGSFPRLTEEEFEAGCYANATLIAFAYDKAGNKGVAFSLQNVQKLADGEPFSGRKNADEEFESVDSGEDDSSNYETTSSSDDDSEGDSDYGI